MSFLPAGATICQYRHRTLWQSLHIMSSVLARENAFSNKCLCLYSEQHGLAVVKNQVMRAVLAVGNRVLDHVSLRLSMAYLVRVSDNWARRVASHGGIFCSELALAAVTSEEARTLDLLSIDSTTNNESQNVAWLHYNVANSVALDMAEDARRVSDHSPTALVQDDVEHCMLMTVWEDENGHMVCSWAMVAPARSVSCSKVGKVGSEAQAMQDVFEREQQGDAFCGPVVTSKTLKRRRVRVPFLPITWHARQSYSNHAVQLWFERP